MAQDIVQILFNEFGLKMSRNMQRQIDNQRTYHQNAKLAATALPPMQEFREPDPMEMFISQSRTDLNHDHFAKKSDQCNHHDELNQGKRSRST